jgi:hypothetical protein
LDVFGTERKEGKALMKTDAYFSEDRKHRYWLIRVWDETLSRIERGMPMDEAMLVKLLAWPFSEPTSKRSAK